MYRDLRDKIDCTIANAFEKKTLTQVVGTVDRGEIIAGKQFQKTLIFVQVIVLFELQLKLFKAPFREADSVTYHRAVIIKTVKRRGKNLALIQFCDYGNIEIEETSCFYQLPASEITGYGPLSSIPMLAIKYRLRGIQCTCKTPLCKANVKVSWMFYRIDSITDISLIDIL